MSAVMSRRHIHGGECLLPWSMSSERQIGRSSIALETEDLSDDSWLVGWLRIGDLLVG